MIIDVGIFQAAAAALVVKAGSMLMEKAWGKNREAVVVGLNSLDEAFENKTGCKFPPELHLIYDQAVKKIVSAVDYIANPVIFRRVERALMALADPLQRERLMAEYLDAVKNKVAGFLSDELKKIINAEKLDEAVKSVGAQAAVSMPPEFLATRNIEADVKDAVIALKHEEPKEINDELLKKLIAESQARQEALRK